MNPERTAQGINKCRSSRRFRQAASPGVQPGNLLFGLRRSSNLPQPAPGSRMAQFPKPNSRRRATRLRMLQAQTVRIARAAGPPVVGVMQTLSRTGGRARLSAGFKRGDLVEIELHTPCGELRALVEMLAPQAEPEGALQSFRFVGLEDEQHERLMKVLKFLWDCGHASGKERF